MSSSSLKVAIIGYGYWGPNLARNFRSLGDCAVARVCDLIPKRLDLARRLCPEAVLATDWRESVRDPSVDAVVISTPVSSHYEIAREALDAGKHVMVEKPMVTGVEEARDLLGRARRRGQVLMVGHTFLYHGPVRKLRDLVRGGDLGRLLYFESTRASFGIVQEDVNVVWDLATHDFSILDYVVEGMLPHSVSATGARHTEREQEDMAYMTLAYPGNLIAHVAVSWISPVKVRRIALGGDRRMVVFDDCESAAKIRIYDRMVARELGPWQRSNEAVRAGATDAEIPEFDGTEALRREAEDFVGAVREAREPVANGESGLRVVHLLECASRSLARGGAPVEVGSAGGVPET